MINLKVAFWALGLLILSLFGMVVVNLFGNITVTDQLNYTSMKNAVEAAMYDSLDIAHYRTGFCLCTNQSKVNEKWVFNDDEQYALTDIVFDQHGKETCSMAGMSTCEVLHNEYRIKPTTFSESLVRRFAEMVNNNKDYVVTIQDIIEYPPKVSVKIVSKDEEYSPTETNSLGYVISNQIDAIIEVKKDATPVAQINRTPTPTPDEGVITPTPTATAGTLCCCSADGSTCSFMNKCTYSQPIPVPKALLGGTCKGITRTPQPTGKCYYITKGGSGYGDSKLYWSKTGTPPDCTDCEYKEQKNANEDTCKNVCHCNVNEKSSKYGQCGFWADLYDSDWIKDGWQRVTISDEKTSKKIYEGSSDANLCVAGCIYTEDQSHDVWRYDWGFVGSSKSKLQSDMKIEYKSNMSKDECVNVCYCKDDNSKCGIYAQKDWPGWYVLKKNANGEVDLEYGTVVTDADDCYYHPKPKDPVCCYSYDEGKYKWEQSGTCTLSGYTVYEPIKYESACQNACYCKGNECGIYAIYDWDANGYPGWKPLVINGVHVTKESECKPQKTTPPPTTKPTPELVKPTPELVKPTHEPTTQPTHVPQPDCTWHFDSRIDITCNAEQNGGYHHERTTGGSGYIDCSTAYRNCKEQADALCRPYGGVKSYGTCSGKQTIIYQCDRSGGGSYTNYCNESGNHSMTCADKCSSSYATSCRCSG